MCVVRPRLTVRSGRMATNSTPSPQNQWHRAEPTIQYSRSQVRGWLCPSRLVTSGSGRTARASFPIDLGLHSLLMRRWLQPLLTLALLVGGLSVGMVASPKPPMDCCAMGLDPGCPCPPPSAPNAPCRALISVPQTVVATRAAQTSVERAVCNNSPATFAPAFELRQVASRRVSWGNRDPDLGRHLAQLGVWRI